MTALHTETNKKPAVHNPQYHRRIDRLTTFAAGAGYAWLTKPFVAELESNRPRAELGLFVEHWLSTMTVAERRQLDALMKWKDAR